MSDASMINKVIDIEAAMMVGGYGVVPVLEGFMVSEADRQIRRYIIPLQSVRTVAGVTHRV